MIWEKRKHSIDHKSIYQYPQFFIFFLIKRLIVRSPERNLNLGNVFILSFVSNEISKDTKKNEYSCELITAQHKALSNFHSANSNVMPLIAVHRWDLNPEPSTMGPLFIELR